MPQSTCRPSSPVVAVVPRAEVAGGVERLAAQRARRPAGGDHPLGAVDERRGSPPGSAGPAAGRGRRDLGVVLVLVGVVRSRPRRRLVLVGRDRLDDDGAGVDVEGQAERADPELLVDRGVQRLVVGRRALGAAGSSTPNRRCASASSSSSFSASSDTCTFSSTTLTSRPPPRACRKNVRSPGRDPRSRPRTAPAARTRTPGGSCPRTLAVTRRAHRAVIAPGWTALAGWIVV